MRVIKMADVLGAAADYGADGLSYGSVEGDSVPDTYIDAILSGGVVDAPQEDILQDVVANTEKENRTELKSLSVLGNPSPAFVRQPVRRGTSLLKR